MVTRPPLGVLTDTTDAEAAWKTGTQLTSPSSCSPGRAWALLQASAPSSGTDQEPLPSAPGVLGSHGLPVSYSPAVLPLLSPLIKLCSGVLTAQIQKHLQTPHPTDH